MSETADPNRTSATQSTSPLLNYLEPATILTVSIGAVYYLGWLQVDSYLRRIGINHLSLNLPTTHYLKQGYLAVSIALIFVNFLGWSREAPKSWREALVSNLVVFTFLTLLLLPFGVSRQQYYFVVIFLVLVAIALAFATWTKRSLVQIAFQPGLRYRLLFLVLLFSLLSVRAMNDGEQQAKRAIEGKGFETSAITLVWKADAPKEVIGKELILILHHENRYFVVEKTSPAPAHPNVFVLPDEIVQYAVTSSRYP
jgi:hypothetical protein